VSHMVSGLVCGVQSFSGIFFKFRVRLLLSMTENV